MIPRLETARALRNTRLSERLWWCDYEAPDTAADAGPGQFAHVLCGPEDAYDPMLRRPMSFSRIEPDEGRVSFLIEVVGRGTAWLVQQPPGTPIDLLGPLGNRFEFVEGGRRALMVAGGIGLAPLLTLAATAPTRDVETVILCGGRDRSALTPRKYVDDRTTYLVATDNGSEGHHGFVTDLVPDRLGWADQIFVCGPTPMMRRMSELSREHDDGATPAFTSLEARMGCAMGVCYSCVVKTRDAVRRVCRDGPVFRQNDLTWEWRHD